MTETADPTCQITERGQKDGVPYVIYESDAGERWRIEGTCNCCGACEVGAVSDDLIWTGVPVGQPGACYDRRGEERPDNPVRPEISADHPCCVLKGEYLEARGS